MSQNDGSLQHILQLPNVPWPVIPREGFHRGCRNVVDCPAHSLCMFLNEVAREQRYVFATLPKRWHTQRKDVEAVIQVGPKFVFVHHGLEVPVRGSHEADIRPDRACAAHSLEFLVLNGTQQFRLKFEWQLANLIKKQRTLVRQLEPSDLLRNRAREGALFMAEELTLQKAGGNRRAVYLDEAAFPARTEFVNRAGDEFFPRSGLPQDENSRICWRNDLEALQNGLERESLSHHVPDIVIEADLVFQIEFFGGESLLHFRQFTVRERIFNCDCDLICDLDKKCDVITGPRIFRHSTKRQRTNGSI